MDLGVAIEQDAVDVRAGFDDFFRNYFDKVVRAAALVAGDAGTGQERAQDAFVRLYERWDSMESDDHARNFVFKVAINLARSHVRKYLRLVPSGLHHADALADENRQPPDEWFEVVRALQALPARQRACVVLVDYADMDAASVARTLHIGTNTVRVHLMRGRQALRQHFGLKDGNDDED